jgi:ABC-2 type transport system ATP-binding protein
MEDIIVVKDLRKVYGDDLVAVDGVSFTVHRGEIFGFLGPNGAGKSTTIKILTTLIGSSGGSVTLDGKGLRDDPASIRRIIGVALQDVGVDDDLTGRENLRLQCRFHHLPKEVTEQKVEDLLRTVNLTEAGDRRLGTYSGGMRKRLDLATALVSDPKILFLDEPTTGLDPQSRKAIWEYIRQLNRQGTTVFLTTQYMEEADQLADRLCIIDEGRIVAEGTPLELKARIGADTIEVEFEDGQLTSQGKAREALAALPGLVEIKACEVGLECGQGVTLLVKNGSSAVPQVVRILDAQGIGVKHLTLATPTLDDVFLKLTGKALKVIEAKQTVRRGRRGRGA